MAQQYSKLLAEAKHEEGEEGKGRGERGEGDAYSLPGEFRVFL